MQTFPARGRRPFPTCVAAAASNAGSNLTLTYQSNFQDSSAPAHEGPPRAFGFGREGILAVAAEFANMNQQNATARIRGRQIVLENVLC
jgi:hypothetical protein